MASKSKLNQIYIPLGIFVSTLLLIGFLRFDSEKAPVPDASAQVSERQSEVSRPAAPEGRSPEPEVEVKSEAPRHVANNEEDAFAVAVEGDPLVVIIPWYEEIGKISIERYDKEGNATGKPLKSGTMVQIPDPSKPGERIRFVVP